MSRRDTIIVAALINAGLLIVLFVSALKDQGEGMAVQESPRAPVESIAFSEPKKMIEDVVPVLPQQEMVAASTSTAQSFVDDLQGLTAPTIPVVAQASPVQEEVASALTEVKVKKGDMLEKIARQHRTSVAEIMKANHLSSTQLKIGQVLKIPSSSVKSQVAVLDAAPSKLYTVKTGDSPWTIAVKNHMKVEELLRLNNMSEEKARRLKPGDQLRIR